MKRVFHLPAIIVLVVCVSCQKQQTEEERNAEVERQVQQRLAAEHQAEEQQRLGQRQSELDAREKALADKEAAAARTPSSSTTKRVRSASGDNATASYSTFYTKLEPHGVWRETSTYGYVWQPREAQESRSWRPYTNGHWVYTEAGWTWVSDEPFGWATYHYGRWTRLRNIGWVWVPGDEWAPAWVSWRKSNDYVGWAPLPPEARFDRGSGIHNWADNYYDIGPDQYCFVPTNDLGAQRVERVVVPAERNVTIINETTNVTNITYNNTTIVNQGPNYDELRSRTQQPIPRLRLERRVAVDLGLGNSQPVVRGDVIEMVAPAIAVPQPQERPRGVKETVTQTVVDHGWEGIADHQAAEKARVKIKAEATAPPNAPSRTFMKPVQASAETTPSGPTATETSPPTSVATSPFGAPTATDATSPRPVATATPHGAPTRSRQTLDVTPSVAPTATPTSTPSPREQPTLSPRATGSNANVGRTSPTPLGTPIKVATPTPLPLASVTPSISTSSSASPAFGRSAEGKEQRKAEKEARKEDKTAERQRNRTSPAGNAASPAPDATASPFLYDARESRKNEKRKQKREREGTAETSESVSPSPSATPQ